MTPKFKISLFFLALLAIMVATAQAQKLSLDQPAQIPENI